MYPGVYPAAHQGATPTKDPVIGGLTPGGDTSEPANNHPRLWVIWVSMAAVAAAAVVAYLLMFASNGDDSAARAAAAEQGILVADDADDAGVRVTEIDRGFRVTREIEGDGVALTSFYDILTASGPLATGDDAGDWDVISLTGATAYLERGDLPRLHVEAGSRFWTVERGLQDVTVVEPRRDTWPDFATIVSFDPSA